MAESHGPAIGCVADGCPPLIPLKEGDIQAFLDRRRLGTTRFTTQRQEAGLKPEQKPEPLDETGPN